MFDQLLDHGSLLPSAVRHRFRLGEILLKNGDLPRREILVRDVSCQLNNRWYVRHRTDDIRPGRDTMRNNLTDRPSRARVPRDFDQCEDGARTRYHYHTGRTMIDYERGLYVVIEQLAKGPNPFPLDHGFGVGTAYRVLGIYNPSESGECWLILSNSDNQLWYISQRHVRTHSIVPNSLDLRRVLAPAMRESEVTV